MDFLANNWGTILIGLILVFAVAMALRSVIKNAKSGGCSSCNCGCQTQVDHCKPIQRPK